VTPIRRNLVISALFAGLWIALAVAQPSTTFHLAPLIVAVWPGLSEREPRTAALLSTVGLLIAAAAALVLSAAGLFRGPSLLPWGGPALESMVAAGVGALLGLIPALVPERESET